jgi:hypothetical protein
MVDIGLGGFHDKPSVGERKLIKFPNVTEGRLADAIALLKAPGTERELRSEAQFRRLYRAASLSWPLPRARRNRLPLLVGAASIASLFATATSLSAASVLPPSAAHVVNGILGPLNADGGSPTTPPASATQPLESGAAATAATGTASSRVASSAVTVGTSRAPANVACRHGRGQCTLHHTHSLHGGTTAAGVTSGANQAVGSNSGSAPTAGAGTPSGTTTSPTGPVSTPTGGTGSGSTPGGGSSGGGTPGGQGGSTPGSGSNRGGNLGPGSGSGGTGHRGHHRGRTGSGAPAGSGKGAGTRRHRHTGLPTTPGTSPSSTVVSTAPDSTVS